VVEYWVRWWRHRPEHGDQVVVAHLRTDLVQTDRKYWYSICPASTLSRVVISPHGPNTSTGARDEQRGEERKPVDVIPVGVTDEDRARAVAHPLRRRPRAGASRAPEPRAAVEDGRCRRRCAPRRTTCFPVSHRAWSGVGTDPVPQNRSASAQFPFARRKDLRLHALAANGASASA
jgi:hypothetical protein